MNYNLTAEILAFICGLGMWKFLEPPVLKLIVVLLGITVLNESVLIPYLIQTQRLSTNAVYNVFSMIDISVWLFVFIKLNPEKKMKVGLLVTAIILTVYSLLEIFLIRGFYRFHADSFKLYCLVMVLLALYFLLRLLSARYYVALKDPLFYICIAVIIYQSMMFLNMTTVGQNKLPTDGLIKFALQLFAILQDIGNISYYLLLCIAFLICFFNQRTKPLAYS